MDGHDFTELEADLRRRTARFERYDRLRGRLSVLLIPAGAIFAALAIAAAFGALDPWLVPEDFLRGRAVARFFATFVLGVLAAYCGVTGVSIRRERAQRMESPGGI